MIRAIKRTDKSDIVQYLVKKLSISFEESEKKARKLLKLNNLCFIKESKNLEGICWVENILVADKKVKKLSFLVDNWKLADDFIKLLRWNLNGEYITEIPKHDFLNRTLSKNGFRFLRLENNKNVYNYRFDLKIFTNYKIDDVD